MREREGEREGGRGGVREREGEREGGRGEDEEGVSKSVREGGKRDGNNAVAECKPTCVFSSSGRDRAGSSTATTTRCIAAPPVDAHTHTRTRTRTRTRTHTCNKLAHLRLSNS